eukprot:TRINITY_DN95645_c0_g1_i1.p1 TRINITY_DN95645_c0_g1~~TRINITY_DN95645_c0_g1_i1.p1  ORF type:complete len:259 (-),score=28.35 TRINITY_DN95645_c0_g1_i1:62-838(-)
MTTFMEEEDRKLNSSLPPVEVSTKAATELKQRVSDLLPLDDANKISDEDLILRFLVLHKFKVSAAETKLREYIQWRKKQGVNDILNTEPATEILTHMRGGFHGRDRLNRPNYYATFSTKDLVDLGHMKNTAKVLNAHTYQVEKQRETIKANGDTVFNLIVDLHDISTGLLTSRSAMAVAKAIVQQDAAMYPENTRYLFLLVPSGFTALWKVFKPLIPDRVLAKTKVIPMADAQVELQKYIDPSQLPPSLPQPGRARKA